MARSCKASRAVYWECVIHRKWRSSIKQLCGVESNQWNEWQGIDAGNDTYMQSKGMVHLWRLAWCLYWPGPDPQIPCAAGNNHAASIMHEQDVEGWGQSQIIQVTWWPCHGWRHQKLFLSPTKPVVLPTVRCIHAVVQHYGGAHWVYPKK